MRLRIHSSLVVSQSDTSTRVNFPTFDPKNVFYNRIYNNYTFVFSQFFLPCKGSIVIIGYWNVKERGERKLMTSYCKCLDATSVCYRMRRAPLIEFNWIKLKLKNDFIKKIKVDNYSEGWSVPSFAFLKGIHNDKDRVHYQNNLIKTNYRN